MSGSKVNLSKKTSENLDYLSLRLGLRPNIICRLAIGKSLSVSSSVKGHLINDSSGREFNRTTLTGQNDDLFKALINQHEYEVSHLRIKESEYFSQYFRRHVERGIEMLYKDYIVINSPTEFLFSIISNKGTRDIPPPD